jgi:hypothetical protein
LTDNEQSELNVLKSFISRSEMATVNAYLPFRPSDYASEKEADSVYNLKTVKDSENTRYIITHYYCSRFPPADSLNSPKYKSLIDTMMIRLKDEKNNQLRNFEYLLYHVGGKNWKYLIIQPLRHYKNKFLYNQLSIPQRENSFVLYDKRQPTKILSCILMAKRGSLYPNSNPKIISWSLTCSEGFWYFTDVYGIPGNDFFIYGTVAPPKYPINIRQELAPFSTQKDTMDTTERRFKISHAYINPFHKN